MVIETLSDVTIENLINQISTMTTFLQAIGGLIILYIVFGIINSVLNRKKGKELKKINDNLEDIKVLFGGKRKKKSK